MDANLCQPDSLVPVYIALVSGLTAVAVAIIKAFDHTAHTREDEE